MHDNGLLRIASTTLCYPSPKAPTRGIFVQQRLRAINRLASVKVVAPVAWFAGFRQEDLADAPQDDPPVWRPKMYYLPKFYKSLDSVFYSRALMRGLRTAFADGPPDLIDAHFEWPDCVGAWIASRKLRIPVVCTLRGKLESQAADVEKRRQMGNMLRCADGLISVSKYLAGAAEKIAEAPLDIKVIPNGIDPSIFSDPMDRAAARQACGWDPDGRYVLSVGHLQDRKGFDRLAAIWPEVLRSFPAARLVLVGGTAGEPGFERRLHEIIKQHGIEERVILVGSVPPKQVGLLLRAADLFALWTKSEGWCNSIAEALACGCPVISTDVGGNREIVHDRRLGQLFNYEDQPAMLKGIGDGLAKDWNREWIASMGQRRTWQNVASECMAVFHEVSPPSRELRRAGIA